MNDIYENPVYSKNVMEFLTVANDYSLTMGKIDSLQKSWLIGYLQKVLPLLYIKASLIPQVQVTNPDINEKYFTEEKWEYLFNELRKLFTNEDEFWFIDPSVSHPDPVKGSISECLTDIFQDIADFLSLYQKNSLDAKENAVNEIRISFYNRWGFLLVNVLKAIHPLITKDLSKGFLREDSFIF